MTDNKTDIADRLRAIASPSAEILPDDVRLNEMVKLCHEAADEIVRIRRGAWIPVAWQSRTKGENWKSFVMDFPLTSGHPDIEVRALYAVPPDLEILNKEPVVVLNGVSFRKEDFDDDFLPFEGGK